MVGLAQRKGCLGNPKLEHMGNLVYLKVRACLTTLLLCALRARSASLTNSAAWAHCTSVGPTSNLRGEEHLLQDPSYDAAAVLQNFAEDNWNLFQFFLAKLNLHLCQVPEWCGACWAGWMRSTSQSLSWCQLLFYWMGSSSALTALSLLWWHSCLLESCSLTYSSLWAW